MRRIRKEIAKGLLYDTDILDKIEDAVYVQLEENKTIFDYWVYQRTLNILNKDGKPVYLLKSGWPLEISSDRPVGFDGRKWIESSLSHHILLGIDLKEGEEDPRIEMLLRPAEGSPLVLHMNNSLKGEDIIGIAQQLAVTLTLLHKCEWGYNDIQPDNIALAKGVVNVAQLCSYLILNANFGDYTKPHNAVAMIIICAKNNYLPPAALEFRTQHRLWEYEQGMISF